MCALPVLALTQRHAAPELANARPRHEASGRLAPFSGPKVRPEHVFCALEAPSLLTQWMHVSFREAGGCDGDDSQKQVL